MRKSTLLLISILAMLLLAGSLMGFTFTMHTNTNYDGNAYIEIRYYPSGELERRIPPVSGYFTIITTSNNTQYANGLDEYQVYTATIYAHRTVGGVTYTDTESVQFGYTSSPHTFTIDLSGKVPDDPPAGD